MTDLETLLPNVTAAVGAAGSTLETRFSPDTRQTSLEGLLAAIDANDAAVAASLRENLLAARPGSRWIEDEEEGGALPDGEWWVVDPAEGNVNHIHGRPFWGVTATLVRDSVAVLTVVRLPMLDQTFTAIRGQGAFINGAPLHVSTKRELDAAIVGTSQGKPGEDAETFNRIGRSVTAMLKAALLVRMSVPATLELVEVAAGRMDGFWQYSQVRAGLAGGALLVEEAGGIVTDTHGQPWSLASADMLATAPGIHAATVKTLSAAA